MKNAHLFHSEGKLHERNIEISVYIFFIPCVLGCYTGMYLGKIQNVKVQYPFIKKEPF